MQKPVKLILGLKEPPCRLVAKELARRGEENSGENCVVAVPTREAARLLKEQLALIAASETGHGAFISPHIVPVSRLAGHAGGKAASPAVSLCVWQTVLRRAGADISLLFPKTDTWQDEGWLHAAEGAKQLFHTLAQENVEIGGQAWQRLAAADARWEILFTLHRQYLDRLDGMGLADPDSSTALPPEVNTRVILACVPGLSRQVEHMLAVSPLPVEVWLACEEHCAAWFDAWGRPKREWLATSDRDELGLARPSWKENLIVTGDAWALAAQTTRAAARANAKGGGALHAVALGVCDTELAPAIAEEFSLHGIATCRPEGIPFSATSWQRVLDAFSDLAEQTHPTAGNDGPDCNALPVAPLTELLRQPVITLGLDIPNAVQALSQLKELRALFLPDRVGFLLKKTEGYAELRQALDILLPWLRHALSSGEALLQTLLDLAEAQPIRNEAERLLAESVRDTCAALLDMGADRLPAAKALGLASAQLGTLAVHGKREGSELSLNGWMELLYTPADRLVIAGMHDKQLPERWPVNPLLTRTARQHLGISSDEDRAARDAYILRTILGSRQPASVTFIFSRFDLRKDPAAPSPLLFTLCPKNRLPEVVAHFFGKDDTRPCSPSPAYDMTGWHYLPLAVPDREPTLEKAAHLRLSDFGLPNPMQGKAFSPTILADFLKCPLRFWIKRVRRLTDDDASDEQETLKQNLVGNCLHRALELFVGRYPSWTSYAADHPDLDLQTDETVESVRHDLLEIFRDTYAAEYGTAPLLPQQMQRENMADRLSVYAGEHVTLWREGWHTLVDAQGKPVVEYKADWIWQGHRMKMKVDRVDECMTPEGGRRLRIIDYKSGKVEGCQKKHLAKLPDDAPSPTVLAPDLEPPLALSKTNSKELSPHRWVELQLPLYVEWARHELPPADLYEAAYICLHRAPSDTRIMVWGTSGERGLFEHEQGKSLIDNAASWGKACMDMIAAGQCLASAEQLGWGAPSYDLFGEATEHATLQDLFLPASSRQTTHSSLSDTGLTE